MTPLHLLENLSVTAIGVLEIGGAIIALAGLVIWLLGGLPKRSPNDPPNSAGRE